MKKKLLATGGLFAASVVPSMAAAADVTGAVSGLAADASTGVVAGLGIGVVLFGAKVVWRGVKGMSK